MSDMTSHDQESSFLLSVNANLDAIVSPAEHSMKQLTAQPSAAVPASPPVPEADPSPHVLPIPTMTATQPQSSFRFSRAIVPPEGDWTCLPADIANADISIAPDGSFVETSSGPAARELKRRYDQSHGVSKDVRSPYAITAFVNQHGKQMYRVGHRDATAPAAEAASRVSSTIDASHHRSLRDRARASAHNAFSQHRAPDQAMKTGQVRNASVSGRRLLRRTRSIPDMFGVAASSSEGPSRQPTPTGRTHSHSVTGADLSHHLPVGAGVDLHSSPTGDIFTEAMQWSSGLAPRSKYAENAASVSEAGYSLHPFGPGVAFDVPSRRSPTFVLPLPRALREMQSFDSCLTARVGDTQPCTHTPKAADDRSLTPPCVPASPFADDSDIPLPDPALAPLPETSMHSRYSTEVFDVLQTYRGLPLLDRLSSDSVGETTIRMSLRADDSAAPRDDPRFVLWGEIQPTSDLDGDDMSLSQGSRAGISSPSASRRGRLGDVPRLHVPSDDSNAEENTPRVIIAATIERWIAQLTSELNYDELLNFFLTYRTYISAVDLCHLLICRFHWSLSGHVTKQDERVRKIVRVRTFVAVRYWLLTFFVVDFLPNRELRLLLASWLNALVRDPVLRKHQDGLSIVRKLIKVVKDCGEAHTRRRRGSVAVHKNMPNVSKPRPTHVLGEKFAEAISRDNDDSDVDLDFPFDDRMSILPGNGNDGTVVPASAALLQQPLQRNILQQSRSSIVIPTTDPQVTPPIALPQGALSRAFVKTIGRLGRWKRVLNSRQAVDTGIAVPADVSVFDLELSADSDLLTVRGGVEQYLKMIEPPPRTPVHSGANAEVEQRPSLEAASLPPQHQDDQSTQRKSVISSQLPPSVETIEEEDGTDTAVMSDRHLSLPQSRVSTRTQGTESFGSVLTSSRVNPVVAQVQAQRPWRFDVVSVDDLDLSDTSSEGHAEGPPAPPGLRRVPRKLPLRREFEFVRRSGQSVSSMGIRSRDSIASENSIMTSGGGALGAGIQQWQVNAIVDSLSDNDEDGGVEDALRRLEGQINPQRRKEKALKVDGWVRAIQERMVTGDFGDEPPRFGQDDDEEEYCVIDQHETGSVRQSVQMNRSSMPAPPSRLSVSGNRDDYFCSASSGSSTGPVVTPCSEPSAGSSDPTSLPKSRPALEDVVPFEILQSRVSCRPSATHDPPLSPPSHGPQVTSPLTSPQKLLAPAGRKSHRSWILNVKADTLVHHFSMIDRELFLGVKPEELILDNWMSCEEVDVLDWAQYLKDRAQWKAQSRFDQKTSALAAVRGRFNLMANFVISEIILTPPTERHTVASKFIRIAIKAYSYSNFHTLTAILTGLRSEWVKKAMGRHWNRVGPWEIQIFQKLCRFITPVDEFKAMRQAITAMVDAKPIDVRSRASTLMSGSTSDSHSRRPNDSVPSACVPFIGAYLSQLYQYGRLPDLIDPTSPHQLVGIDAQSLSFNSPARSDVFESLTPLPPSMQLEPLINVHKQRLIAGVIKDLVAGQHLASRVHFAIDKKLFQKCLKIRGLDSDTLRKVYIMYLDPSAEPVRLVSWMFLSLLFVTWELMVFPFPWRNGSKGEPKQEQDTERSPTYFLSRLNDHAVLLAAPYAVAIFIFGVALGTGGSFAWRRWLKRIRTAEWVTPDVLTRRRWLKGMVTSVGDADNFRIYHMPGIGWRWPLKFRRVPTLVKDLKDQTIHIRIAGIDAPEGPHFGRPAQPYYEESLSWLKRRISGQIVYCQLIKRDQYGRIVAVPLIPHRFLPNFLCKRWGRSLALEMLRNGTATTYEQGGAEYGYRSREEFLRVETEARAARRGMWKYKIGESPAEYKRRYALIAASSAPSRGSKDSS